MSKLWLVLLAGILVVGMMAGCNKVSADQNYTDPAQPINAEVGDVFTIQLASNPTTGYEWQYTGIGSHVRLLEQTYKAGEPVAIGSGGSDIFTFKAEGEGSATLTFNYKRSWEPDSIDQKVFTLVVS